MDGTTEGEGVRVGVVPVVIALDDDVRDVVKSERVQGDDDKDGGEDEEEEVDNFVVVGVNVKGGGLGGAGRLENVIVVIMSILPGVGADIDVDPHEFLLPFLFFWACNFKLPDLLAALIAAWLLGIWLWVVPLLEVEAVEEW